MSHILLFVAAAAALFNVAASADTSEVMFSADAVVRVPNGHYNAKIYYLYNRTRQYLRYDYTTPLKMTDLIDYVEGSRYKVCTKCESGFYKYPAPVLYKQATDKKTSEVENGCTKYIPADTSGVTALWYKADGTICKAELPEGKTLILSNIDKTFKDRSLFNLLGKQCPAPVCKRVMDIEVVVDNSGSVGKSNWNGPIKNFLYQLVNLFDLGPDATQIGLLTYSTGTRNVFDLSYDAATMNRTIKNAAYKQGGTCTGCGIHAGIDALKKASTHRKELDPEKILMVITDGENWDKSGTPCANYAPVCTKRGTKCIKYTCDNGYTYKDTNVCAQYVDDTTKCKRYMCEHCKNNKWGANCLKRECVKRDNNKCAVRDTSYCELAYPDCSVKNGAIVQNKNVPCLCSKYKCVENECTKYNCSEYSCDSCTKYSTKCAEYEKKCAKYSQTKTCSGKETCAEYECIAGDIKCTKTYNSKQAMIVGSIIRARTQWALYPTTTRLPILISIGVGKCIEKELMATASTIQGKTLMYKVSDFKSLSTIFDDLIEETCVSKAESLEACDSKCYGLCGCEGKCYCPICDKSTGHCYSIGCTTDYKTSGGCVVTHNTCPNKNKCITLKPDNNTVGCCVESPVDCRRFGNKCFNAKCNNNTGCYSEPIEPTPNSTCFVGDKCYNSSGWTYKSACPIIDKCTINKCTVLPDGFSCDPLFKCDSHDRCINDTCDLATGQCTHVHKVCNSTNKCVIPYCYDGECYEKVNITLKNECNKFTNAENCDRGYCDAATGTCKVESYKGTPSCSYCRDYDMKNCTGPKCYNYECGVDENNVPFCNRTDSCVPSNPCEIAYCDEATEECVRKPVSCKPLPCHTAMCVVDDAEKDGYRCEQTPLGTNTSCVERICDETTNTYVIKSKCPEPAACFEAGECNVMDNGAANCTYTPKVCKARSKCEVAYCDESINDCVYEDISESLCPRKPCQTVKCLPDGTCDYQPITCDYGDKCVIDECVAMSAYSPSKYPDDDDYKDEFFNESSANLAYVCVRKPKCPQTAYCTNASCYKGECTYFRYTCGDVDKSLLDDCHDYECSDVTNSCVSVLLPSAFLDVCGSCVKNYGDDSELNDTIAAVQCIGKMKMPDFAAAISGGALAAIIIAAIIVAAIIGISSTLGTRELIKRAKKNADVGTNSNPLYEGNDNEGFNPAFTGDN